MFFVKNTYLCHILMKHIMETLFARHDEYLSLVPMDFVRGTMEMVNWDNRLICIKGPKGVGKSTLLLQRIRMNFDEGDRHVLYCSADTGYFTTHTLVDTAASFVRIGGTHLFIDEIHKYDGWSRELKEIYDLYKGLHVVVSGSSLLQLNDGDADLSRRMISYEMPGLSFREYLCMVTGKKFNAVSLDELLDNPAGFCNGIRKECRPLEFFKDYLKAGYYPFCFEDKAGYGVRVENVLNYIIETELPNLRKVETGNTRKIKALLQVVAQLVPFEIDISKIATKIGIQRTTVLAYFKYLDEAQIINRIFTDIDSMGDLQKPDKILLDNPNLLYVLSDKAPETGTVRESFFCNQLRSSGHRVEYGGIKTGDFRIDKQVVIEVGGSSKGFAQIGEEDRKTGYVAADDIDTAVGRKLPLWAFGFLY